MKNSKNIDKKKKFLIVGRSSSGKTAIVREVCKQLNLTQVKSYTTRPPREKEVKYPELSDHYFIDESEVEKYRDDIVAYTEIKGNKYFTTKNILDSSDLYVIDPNGIDYLKRECGNEYNFIVVYVRVTAKIGLLRAKDRGDDLDVYKERIKAEDEQFSQFEKNMLWDYHILNNDSFERAVETMKKIIKKELCL